MGRLPRDLAGFHRRCFYPPLLPPAFRILYTSVNRIGDDKTWLLLRTAGNVLRCRSTLQVRT